MSEKVVNVIVSILVDLGRAWFLMLSLGVIHAHYAEVPAVSYWIALMVIVAVDQLHKVDLKQTGESA